MQAAKRIARRANRALERAATAAVLAPAPVAVEVARLSPSAELVEVDAVVFDSTPPAFAPVDDEAAVRASVRQAYGPKVRRVVLVGFVGDPLTVQELELVGQLSDVERTAPDRETLRRWVQAGVRGVMGAGLPILKQMERRSL